MSYGTIGADTIQTSGANLAPVFKDLNNSVVGTLPKSAQIAKAWVNFNGTLTGTITPRASYNVSSVTKNGTGDYTVNFTTAMSDANYVAVYTAGGTGYLGGINSTTAPTVSSVRLLTVNTASAADSTYSNVIILGN